MVNLNDFHPTKCVICDTFGNATEIYPANFDLEAFNPGIFSARRLPDRIHYRIIRCKVCGLVRSDPVVNRRILASLYTQSSFSYADEAINSRYAYGRYLDRLNKYLTEKNTLLEIGCGNGFFLEEAIARGYKNVLGVEPSIDALNKANPSIRRSIINDVMRPGLFEPDRFDVICMFQVLDHIPDPEIFLKECFSVLKPGGLVLCLNHNIEALSAYFFKENSPIVDIEHTYLYSPKTISKVFSLRGFKILETGSVLNNYTLHYLVRLLPMPRQLKNKILSVLSSSLIGRLRLAVPLGNLYLIAQKPK